MLQAFTSFLLVYWPIILALVVGTILFIIIIVNWEQVRFALMRFGTNFPLLGKVSKLAKKPQRINSDSGYREADQTIAEAYLYYYKKHPDDGTFFEKCEDYLLKVGEHNRKKKGALLWIIIFLMVLTEAAAFGLALAPYALTQSVTPNMAIGGAAGIGLLISIAALLLSEKTGHQMYSNRMINQLMSHAAVRRKNGKSHDGNDIDDRTLQQSNLINVSNTFDDKDRPRYQQILNRFDPDRDARTGLPKKSYWISIAYLLFIFLLAVGAYLVRSNTLEAQEAEIIDNPMASFEMQSDFPISSGEDDFPLPSGTAKHSENAEVKTAQDRLDALHEASLITFVILSGLFVFIQVASTFLAYAYGFVGAKSEEAWKSTKDFKNADEFAQYNQRKADSIAVDAQASLTHLADQIAARPYLDGQDEAAKDLPAINFKEFVQKDALKDQIKSYLSRIKMHRSKSEKELEAATRAELAALLNRIPEGMLSKEVLNQAILSTDSHAAHSAVVVDETQQVTAASLPGNSIHQPLPVEENNKPELTSSMVESVPTSAPESIQSGGGKNAFDAYQWGDLLALEESDLTGIAVDLDVSEKDLRRAYTIQKMKRGAKA